MPARACHFLDDHGHNFRLGNGHQASNSAGVAMIYGVAFLVLLTVQP